MEVAKIGAQANTDGTATAKPKPADLPNFVSLKGHLSVLSLDGREQWLSVWAQTSPDNMKLLISMSNSPKASDVGHSKTGPLKMYVECA